MEVFISAEVFHNSSVVNAIDYLDYFRIRQPSAYNNTLHRSKYISEKNMLLKISSLQ